LAAGQVRIFWDVDAPATLDRVLSDKSDLFRASIPEYSAIFTYGGGQRVVDAYLGLGARSCTPIYNAVDPDTHFPVPLDPKFESILAFQGNRLPDRENRVDEFFFKPAAIQSAQIFLLGGSGWDDKPRPANVRYIGHVSTQAHNAFNSSARFVLNINRDSMATYGFSPPTRVFEAAAAGACLITDAWEGIEMFLQPGREILVAQDGAEVADIVQNVPAAEAKAIGNAGRSRVLAEHTYRHRAMEVDSILRELHPSSPAIQKVYA
jgi:spore maturation protein CgeB